MILVVEIEYHGVSSAPGSSNGLSFTISANAVVGANYIAYKLQRAASNDKYVETDTNGVRIVVRQGGEWLVFCFPFGMQDSSVRVRVRVRVCTCACACALPRQWGQIRHCRGRCPFWQRMSLWSPFAAL